MIKGTKTAVRAVRKMVDAESRLPDKRAPYPCPCGEHGITVHDDDRDLVACTRCGKVRHAGGATLRVYRDRERKDGAWECEVSEEVEEKIAAAKGKPGAAQSKDEKVLSAVEVTKKPDGDVIEKERE